MFDLESIGKLQEFDAIELLKKFDGSYFNGEPEIDDTHYDAIRLLIQQNWPDNPYFKLIGAKDRGSELKHEMPVAGLNQFRDEEEIKVWLNTVTGDDIIISEKLDGGSGTLTYNKKTLKLGATRGDGIFGKDISRHILSFQSIPQRISIEDTIHIRGELIISKANFPIVQQLLLELSGKIYKNARNTITGQINASKIDAEVLPYLDFVAYDIANSSLDKEEQFLLLKKLGFKVAKYLKFKSSELSEQMLNSILFQLKTDSEYDCDGIVVDINDGLKRFELRPSESNLLPKTAFKWKVNGEESMRTSTCIGIEWNVSKDNYIKPVVLIEPVDLGGVTIKRLSGFNMKFIVENMISTGAVIKFCRSGDVIPHIVDVIEKAPTLDLPDIEWEWSEKEVDAIAVENTPRAHLLKVKDFFNGLKVDNLQEASIEKLIDASYDSILKIIELTEDELIEVLGKNGSKAFQSLHKVLSDCDLATLMGSYPSFGRGFGKRKAKALINGVNDWITATHEDIVKVEGYSDKSAITFLVGRDNFLAFYHHLIAHNYLKVKVKEEITGILSGLSFAFTGIRSKEAEDKIIAQGGIVHDGVKRDTTYLVAKDPKASSGKLDKARKQGTKVVSLVELNDIIDPTSN
jgi:NAD-dependent DNA ligase